VDLATLELGADPIPTGTSFRGIPWEKLREMAARGESFEES